MSQAQRRSLRRPGKLFRVLTSWVATKVAVSHPANPVVEEPCRWGTMVGFALVNEQFGYGAGGSRELSGFHINLPANPVAGDYYEDGETPVSFQMNEWVAKIRNHGAAAAVPGDLVYYFDDPDNPAYPHLAVNPPDSIGAADAFAGMLKEGIPANTTADVVLLLMNVPVAPLAHDVIQ